MRKYSYILIPCAVLLATALGFHFRKAGSSFLAGKENGQTHTGNDLGNNRGGPLQTHPTSASRIDTAISVNESSRISDANFSGAPLQDTPQSTLLPSTSTPPTALLTPGVQSADVEVSPEGLLRDVSPLPDGRGQASLRMQIMPLPPGVQPEDVDVSMDGLVTISGQQTGSHKQARLRKPLLTLPSGIKPGDVVVTKDGLFWDLERQWDKLQAISKK